MQKIIQSTNELNKKEKLKILFFKADILDKLIEEKTSEINEIHKRKNNIIYINLFMNLGLFISFLLLTLSSNNSIQFFGLIFCIIFCGIIAFRSNFHDLIIGNKIKEKEDLLFKIDEINFLKLSIDDEFLIKGTIKEYINNFSVDELVDFSKDELFKTGDFYSFELVIKNLNIQTEKMTAIIKSKQFIEYYISEKTDNEEYNFVKNICGLDKLSLKNYIRDNYDSDFLKENKDKIKSEIEKDTSFFNYELLILNKIK